MRDWSQLSETVLAEIDARQKRVRVRKFVISCVLLIWILAMVWPVNQPLIYDTPAFTAQLSDGSTFIMFEVEPRHE